MKVPFHDRVHAHDRDHVHGHDHARDHGHVHDRDHHQKERESRTLLYLLGE